MQKLSIITALLVFSFSAAGAVSGREKVLIFNLEIIHEKSILVDRHGKNKEERYDYYSLIIPHTIAKNLNASGNVEAQKIAGTLPLADIGSDEFYSQMASIAEQHAAGYLLGGKGTIRGKKLTLELALVDPKGKSFTPITKETFETGAEMRGIITELSADIEQKLEAAIREAGPPKKGTEPLPAEEEEARPAPGETEMKKETAPGPVPVSPFLAMYRALDGLSFGIMAGSFFIKGSFQKLYGDAEYVSPYIRYGILPWLGVTAQVDYLAATNDTQFVTKHSSLALWGVSLNADFTWWLFSHFGVRLTAGAGVSHGRLYVGSADNPFDGITRTTTSTDPYLNIAASAVMQYRPVELQFGGSYKSAFFTGKVLSLITVFFGIGYHL